MENKKVVVIPGAFQYVKNYGGLSGIDIWLKGKCNNEMLEEADFIVAHSMGANYVFSLPISGNQKFILINPLVKRRNFLNLLIRDFRYIFSKEMNMSKVVPASNWLQAFWRVYTLSKINILPVLKKIPKENIFMIRGNRDCFFCDNEAVSLIKIENFRLTEVDAGHDWNDNIAQAVNKIINDK